MTWRRDPKRPRYIISIAAELASGASPHAADLRGGGPRLPAAAQQPPPLLEADIKRVRIIRFLTRRQGVNLAGVKVILQLESTGKIRVYDLFDEDDVERLCPTIRSPSPPPSPSPRPSPKTSSR